MLYLNSNLKEPFSGTSVISDKYVITGEVLGQGSYAKVFRGHMKANPNIQIAIKEIELSGKVNNPKFLQTLDREISILRRFNHPNIIQLYDVVRLPDKMFIFLEICVKLHFSQKSIFFRISLFYFFAKFDFFPNFHFPGGRRSEEADHWTETEDLPREAGPADNGSDH